MNQSVLAKNNNKKEAASMSEPVVSIKNVSKKIGKKLIIDNISFDIYPGEVFGFLGPNGAGKTTTIRMLLGLAGITQGEIFINGYSINKNFKKAISCVGGIVENPEMYKYISGYDNILNYSRMYDGISRQRVDEVVKLMGLENRIKDKVKKYSLGMRQRLGVAQALLHKPKLLVLDEPTNGLDPAGIKELRDMLRGLAKTEGLSVLVSSHLLSEMELMCDRVAIIQNGRIMEIRALNEINNNDSQKSDIVFNVKPVNAAADIIKNKFADTAFVVSGNEIKATMAEETIPEIVKALVAADVKVYRVWQVKKSLETEFLEVTGGNVID